MHCTLQQEVDRDTGEKSTATSDYFCEQEEGSRCPSERSRKNGSKYLFMLTLTQGATSIVLSFHFISGRSS